MRGMSLAAKFRSSSRRKTVPIIVMSAVIAARRYSTAARSSFWIVSSCARSATQSMKRRHSGFKTTHVFSAALSFAILCFGHSTVFACPSIVKPLRAPRAALFFARGHLNNWTWPGRRGSPKRHMMDGNGPAGNILAFFVISI
jgi:hypothetical protein